MPGELSLLLKGSLRRQDVTKRQFLINWGREQAEFLR